MLSLNLPPYATKVAVRDGKNTIWDIIRRKYVALTPEEWVRQHFVHFLVEHKGYPASLLANEVALTLNGTSRRCDTVLYDRTLSPRMIIEYKAPHIPITQKVFDQICRYNLVFRVDYLIVSNGLSHYCCRMDYAHQSYQFLTDVPEYGEL
ncbi:MAG: type I restriction enzyme HsdR N-terminal domain-containing protein [Bacteroidaceae bacterium]|nr:type I restriction enzyme HsdR N-terminal domain-containing protein [Bacteroidaceae bacterium]